jgi:hypothetical protein
MEEGQGGGVHAEMMMWLRSAPTYDFAQTLKATAPSRPSSVEEEGGA